MKKFPDFSLTFPVFFPFSLTFFDNIFYGLSSIFLKLWPPLTNIPLKEYQIVKYLHSNSCPGPKKNSACRGCYIIPAPPLNRHFGNAPDMVWLKYHPKIQWYFISWLILIHEPQFSLTHLKFPDWEKLSHFSRFSLFSSAGRNPVSGSNPLPNNKVKMLSFSWNIFRFKIFEIWWILRPILVNYFYA